MDLLYKPASESDIYDGVRSLRALIKEKNDMATAYHLYHWLREAPDGGRDPAMVKMLISFNQVIESRNRSLRIEVMNVMMGTEHYSTKDLWLSEIYAWISWFEEDGSRVGILGAVSMAPHIWAERLANIPEVKRPKGMPYIPDEPEPVTEGPTWTNVQMPELEVDFIPL